MGTSAKIIIKNASGMAAGGSFFFYRHYDGYMGANTATMFYNFFSQYEALSKKTTIRGDIAKFLNANSADVEQIAESCNIYHYFLYELDLADKSLTVTETETNLVVFSGNVADYMAEHLFNGKQCAMTVHLGSGVAPIFTTATGLINTFKNLVREAIGQKGAYTRYLDYANNAMKYLTSIELDEYDRKEVIAYAKLLNELFQKVA